MFGWIKRWSAIAALFVALFLVLPVMAQSGVDNSGRSDTNGSSYTTTRALEAAPDQSDRAASPAKCLQAGLGLVVLSADGTVADILGSEPKSNTAALAASRSMTVVLDAPATVGGCADFQAYWGGGVKGAAVARLSLLAASATNASTPVAKDGAEETRTGPASFNKHLSAQTKIEKPGTYGFTVVYEVEAKPEGGDAKVDSVRLPLTVIFREKPKPGAIEGTVTDADGKPVAGARIAAAPAVAPIAGGSTRPPLIGLPVERPVVVGSADTDAVAQQPNDKGSVLTDAAGKYRLVIAPGKYAVSAEMRGFKLQWYNGKDSARLADPVEVKPEENTTGIDFKLVPVTPKPEPSRDKGTIAGKVTDATGTPLKGAQVLVTLPPTAAGPANPPLADQPEQGRNASYTVRTDEKGLYEVKVPVGKWIAQAGNDLYATQWFDGQAEAKLAKVLEVVKDGKVENVDFHLAKLPQATVSGKLTKADGSVVKGGNVQATTRGTDGKAVPIKAAGGYRTSARTAEDGTYSLILPPGQYAISASVATVSSRAGTTIWWDKKTKLADADLLDLADGAARSDINFQFP